MSLQSNTTAAFARAAAECKSLRTLINNNSASLTGLNTVAQTDLVSAINELVADLTVVRNNGATINDASTSSASETFSVDKIIQLVTDVKAEILGGADSAQDTLQELKDYLDSGQAADVTALANRLRVDTAAQGLTSSQKQNARTNIDVFSMAEIGDVNADFVATFEAALV